MLNLFSQEAIQKIEEKTDAVVYGVYGNESSDFCNKAEALLLRSLVLYTGLHNLAGDSDVDLIVKIQELLSDLENEENKIKETLDRYPGNSRNAYATLINYKPKIKSSIAMGLNHRLDKILNDFKESTSQLSQLNTLVVGPPSSGKTLRFVVPNILLENKKSILVFDLKKEIAAHTENQKVKQGYKVKHVDLGEIENLKEILHNFVKEKMVLYVHMQSILSEGLNEHTTELILSLFEEVNSINGKADQEQFNGISIFLEETGYYKVQNLQNILAVSTGYRVYFTFIIQSLNTLEKSYGLEASDSILANCNTKLIMGITNPRDAEYFSQLCGEKVIKDEQNKNVKRKNLTKDELLGLHSEQAILLQTGEQFRIIDKLPFGYGADTDEN
ncbi:type IV secretory system conjugative DNA transfer family protein [Bacillus thuringiensis]|uniref:TraD/TraG TraM recognition site domain-containing protein n=1 Tax=Bacillus cereus (strain VD146) TaxID=1053236 RepID=R8MDX5_BACCX|nr:MULTISPECIES: type IV secretory system conjugative DNA transfer family protein [Bacillus cereus group]EOP32331.1 hypothetical protein IK1_05867 [Bacillus cereus VD146]MDZ3956262.1 type IV secretory system conjugative DNA transfer family protein [Bacillus thuringiensis]RGP43397.1 hypothetical protein BTW32_29755 [Bacillus thuringiensis]